MAKVIAGLTTSVDGYYVGPNDGPGKGPCQGGERLHYWVFGGPWSCDAEPRGEPTGEHARFLNEMMATLGAVVAGRWTNEAADHWGGKNPWGLPVFIVTHRPQEQPAGNDFVFVSGVDTAVKRAVEVAGSKDVNVMGGGDIIRQALSANLVDELWTILAPITLGGGRRLFDGLARPLELEPFTVRQSALAAFIGYRLKKS